MQAARLDLPTVLIVLLLAGCGSAPTQEQIEQDVDTAVQLQTPAVPADWGEQAEAGAVQTGWIESFNDPALTELVIEAQTNNLEVAAAAANVNRAWALARQAGAALSPDIGLTASGTQTGSVESSRPDATNLTLGAQVSWELDVWGRLRSGQRGAIASAQAVEADFRSARQSLAAATAKAYFSAIEANIQADIARQTVQLLKETQRIVTVKYENGMVSGQDVSLARSDLATARERLTAVEGSYRDALRALEVLLGRYPGADLEVRNSLPEVPPPPPAGLPAELLERRPDIVAAERRVAAAFNATEQARAARLPAISLTGSLGGASRSLSDLLNPSNIAWSAGASLLAPIYDGGRLREAVTIATAEQEQALAGYGKAALEAFSELETNLDQGLVVKQRIVDLEDAVAAGANAYRIVKIRYEEGEEELLNVLTIQQRVISSMSSLSSVQRLLLEQRVNLNLALGGSWES